MLFTIFLELVDSLLRFIMFRWFISILFVLIALKHYSVNNIKVFQALDFILKLFRRF